MGAVAMHSSTPTEAHRDLKGSVAVVVGGAGGIGRAVALRLGGAGCRLALVDLEHEALETAVREMGLESSTLIVPTDITRPGKVEAMARKVASCLGCVDILVNTAGTNTPERTFDDLSAEQWEHVIAVNLSGVFHCTQALLPVFRESGGQVINVVSTAAVLTSPGAGTHYCAAKRALLSLTESINIEQAHRGIHACAISPGEVATPLMNKRPVPPDEAHVAAMLRPEDVAEAVYFVASRPPRVAITQLTMFPRSQLAGTYTV
jgi:NAD(P)-dependent dehydrogenase (short-subunit alcohol dehydrogenase family)